MQEGSLSYPPPLEALLQLPVAQELRSLLAKQMCPTPF